MANLTVGVINAPPDTTHFALYLCSNDLSAGYAHVEPEEYISIENQFSFDIPGNAVFPLFVVNLMGVKPTPGNPSAWTATFYVQSFTPGASGYTAGAVINQELFTNGQIWYDVNTGQFLPSTANKIDINITNTSEKAGAGWPVMLDVITQAKVQGTFIINDIQSLPFNAGQTKTVSYPLAIGAEWYTGDKLLTIDCLVKSPDGGIHGSDYLEVSIPYLEIENLIMYYPDQLYSGEDLILTLLILHRGAAHTLRLQGSFSGGGIFLAGNATEHLPDTSPYPEGWLWSQAGILIPTVGVPPGVYSLYVTNDFNDLYDSATMQIL